jgi:hypothetical protein
MRINGILFGDPRCCHRVFKLLYHCPSEMQSPELHSIFCLNFQFTNIYFLLVFPVIWGVKSRKQCPLFFWVTLLFIYINITFISFYFYCETERMMVWRNDRGINSMKSIFYYSISSHSRWYPIQYDITRQQKKKSSLSVI